MTPKEQINALIDHILKMDKGNRLKFMLDYSDTLDIEEIFYMDGQLLFNYTAGVVQILGNVENHDEALKEFKNTDDPIFYELINKYK